MNSCFENACNRVSQPCPPIWYMRQAGRYHSHYRKLKEKYTFEQLCKIPELAAEVACGPVKEFNLDVAILFSDILFPLEGLGMELRYNPGPQLAGALHKDVAEAIEHMKFQAEALKITREMLDNNVSLIGFVGGPHTIKQYGGNAKLEHLITLLKANINLQLEAGAEKVMIFDSGVATVDDWPAYVQLLKPLVSSNVGYYCKEQDVNAVTHYDWAGIGIDCTQNLHTLLNNTTKGFVQGNFNEQHLLLPKDELKNKLNIYCDQMEETNRTGWVCGLGHGVNKNTPEYNVHLFVDTIRRRFS
ncbi:uncharacterized protein METZ01_LOCUS219963 [marine metagenome]|uniref:Uroporphyrinogen decarboxylase (URO-D) domain-containing protein n=1 Tax=marine metagenome TaxID=408172 RepID=A0A382FWV6_9ZZZZ